MSTRCEGKDQPLIRSAHGPIAMCPVCKKYFRRKRVGQKTPGHLKPEKKTK